MRVPTELRLSQWLAAHIQNLGHWTDLASGRVLDPFESHQHDAHILAESYSPATALVAAATAAAQSSPRAAALIPGYCSRVVQILASDATAPFTALFVQYFGLLALAHLRTLATQLNPPLNLQQVDQLAGTLCTFQDRLDEPLNANCAAMQAGVQMLRQVYSCKADWARCRRQLEVVAAQQTPSGFINDDLAGPSMPVAYHMFCMYLLAAALCRLNAAGAPGEAAEVPQLADSIVTRGYAWLGHLLANDGMIAQYGRSRYHAFSQAAGVTLLAAAGTESDDATVRRYLAWMDHYRLAIEGPPDSSPSSIFAVTPNLCPPAMRVGFESYGMVTVYNNLAIAILLDAQAWWAARLPPIPGAAEARRLFLNAARERGFYGDAQTGLVRLRSRAGYVLVNLLTDYRGTTPLGSLMHLRLGDDLHEKAVSPVFWADPRIQADVPSLSVWEGPLLCDSPQDDPSLAGPPDFLMRARTVECKSTPSSLMLRCSHSQADVSRSIILEPQTLRLRWQVKANEASGRLLATVPCLLWDGLNETTLRFDGPRVLATLAGRTWQMTILDGQANPMPGQWFLSPQRSTLSTSGVTGRLVFPLAESVQAGQQIDWTIRIELFPPQFRS